MGVSTGLPFMVPFYIFLYSFTMAVTAFFPNFFIPTFAEIFVDMTSVATLMNESVSYFDSFSPIKIGSLNCMSYHRKTLPIGVFLRRCSPSLVYFLCSSILHRLSLLGIYQWPHCCPAWIFLLLGKYRPLPLPLLMWLICCRLRLILLLLILGILLLYCYQDHYYQVHLILGSFHMHPRPCLLPHKFLPRFLLQARLQGFLHQILSLNSLSCRTKWVFLVLI